MPAALSKVRICLLKALRRFVQPEIKSKTKPCLRLSLQIRTPKKFDTDTCTNLHPVNSFKEKPVGKHDLYMVLMGCCTNLGSEKYKLPCETESSYWLDWNWITWSWFGWGCTVGDKQQYYLHHHVSSHNEAMVKRLFVLGTQPRQRKLWGEEMKLLLLCLSSRLVNSEAAVCKPWLLQGKELADSDVELRPVSFPVEFSSYISSQSLSSRAKQYCSTSSHAWPFRKIDKATGRAACSCVTGSP